MNGAFAQTRPIAVPLVSAQWCHVTELRGSPDWLVDARKRLGRLASLSDNWDGEGGLSLHPAAFDSARRLLEEIEPYRELPPVHIGPSMAGGLGLEWRFESRDLDIDILPDGSIEFLKSSRLGSEFDVSNMEDGQISPENMKEARRLVRWLIMGA
jgi:hypothetical protein